MNFYFKQYIQGTSIQVISINISSSKKKQKKNLRSQKNEMINFFVKIKKKCLKYY